MPIYASAGSDEGRQCAALESAAPAGAAQQLLAALLATSHSAALGLGAALLCAAALALLRWRLSGGSVEHLLRVHRRRIPLFPSHRQPPTNDGSEDGDKNKEELPECFPDGSWTDPMLAVEWRRLHPEVITLEEYLRSCDFSAAGDKEFDQMALTLISAIGGGAMLWVAAPLVSMLPGRLRESVERNLGPSHVSQALAAVSRVGVHPLVPAALAEGVHRMRQRRRRLFAAREGKTTSTENDMNDERASDAAEPRPGCNSIGNRHVDPLFTTDPDDPIVRLCIGDEPGQLSDALKEIPFGTTFVVERDIPKLLQELGNPTYEHEPKPTPQPFADLLFPGLCITSNVGMRDPPKKQALNGIWAAILNRLTANTFVRLSCTTPKQPENGHTGSAHESMTEPHHMGPPCEEFPRELFRVKIQETDESEAISVEQMMRMLSQADPECTLKGFLTTNTTSLSTYFCLKEDEDFYRPVCVTYKSPTSIQKRNPDRTLVDIPTYARHAGVHLVCENHKTIPLAHFEIQQYVGIEGFTGFHPLNVTNLPWVEGCANRTFHMEYENQSSLSAEENKQREHMHAIEVATIAAAASVPSCLEARDQNYMMGGYAMIGVCLDSAALIQVAMTGSTDLFNLGGIQMPVFPWPVRALSSQSKQQMRCKPVASSP